MSEVNPLKRLTGDLLLLSVVVGFAACSPASETDVSPAPTDRTPAATDWPAEFRRTHGSTYDPNSRTDREKMAKIKDPPRDSVSEDRGPAGTIDHLSRKDIRDSILAVARPLIGQTETHAANRSPLIDKMNRLTGVPLGSPYCASFNTWCYSEANAPGKWPKSAWSPDWVKSPTWTAAKGGKKPKPGDAFGIWFTSKGRVAHTGLIESWGDVSTVTIEGNTTPSAEFGAANDRDGDGVWMKRRMRFQIHSVRDWVGE